MYFKTSKIIVHSQDHSCFNYVHVHVEEHHREDEELQLKPPSTVSFQFYLTEVSHTSSPPVRQCSLTMVSTWDGLIGPFLQCHCADSVQSPSYMVHDVWLCTFDMSSRDISLILLPHPLIRVKCCYSYQGMETVLSEEVVHYREVLRARKVVPDTLQFKTHLFKTRLFYQGAKMKKQNYYGANTKLGYLLGIINMF